MYDIVLFDLDGTLTESGPGIVNSAIYALDHYGIEVKDRSELLKFVGPPLKDSFMNFYGFSDEKADEAVTVFRQYFRAKGMYENSPYPGIREVLEKLQGRGLTLAVATSKVEDMAVKILEHFDLLKYFKLVVGSGYDGSLGTKAAVVAETLRRCVCGVGAGQTAAACGTGAGQTAAACGTGAGQTAAACGTGAGQTAAACGTGAGQTAVACGTGAGQTAAACGTGAGQTAAACGTGAGQTAAACGTGAGQTAAACGTGAGQTAAACGTGAGQTAAACGTGAGQTAAACGTGAGQTAAACGTGAGQTAAACGTGAGQTAAACGTGAGQTAAACGTGACEAVSMKRAVMIGDRHHDIEGAIANGIDSIGVLYGYGSREELEEAGATYIAETEADILKYLI